MSFPYALACSLAGGLLTSYHAYLPDYALLLPACLTIFVSTKVLRYERWRCFCSFRGSFARQCGVSDFPPRRRGHRVDGLSNGLRSLAQGAGSKVAPLISLKDPALSRE